MSAAINVDPVNISGADQAVYVGKGKYHGFSFKETSAGASAHIVIYDNASAASGTILEEVNLLSDESAREFYEAGIVFNNGVYVDIIDGAVAGSVRLQRY